MRTSQATCFSRRKKGARLLPDETRRPKALEDESGRLEVVAGRTLDPETLQDVIRQKT